MDDDYLAVHYSPAYSWIFLLFACCASVVFTLSTWGLLVSSQWLWSIVSLTLLTASYLAVWRYFVLIRDRSPIAELRADGITVGKDQIYLWFQIGKIYKSTGVLFLQDQSCRGWIVRLDPSEIGWRKRNEIVDFIKAHAPTQLTEKL